MSIHWSIVLAKVDLVALYFHLLWCHSILRGSIDQKHTKQTKFEDKTVESTQLSLVVVGLHNFQIFPGHTAHVCVYVCVKRGSGKHMFGPSLFRPSRQSNISTPGKERFKHPLPWENKMSQMPHPRANEENQIPTPCPVSPRRHNIDRCT